MRSNERKTSTNKNILDRAELPAMHSMYEEMWTHSSLDCVDVRMQSICVECAHKQGNKNVHAVCECAVCLSARRAR